MSEEHKSTTKFCCTSEGDKFRTKPMCGYVDVCLNKANLQQDPIMTMYL